MEPRGQNDFPRLWEDRANPDRVTCERQMKKNGSPVPGIFNGWGGRVRLAQKKMIEIADRPGRNDKLVPMYCVTTRGQEWIAARDDKASGKGEKPATDNAPPKE